MIIVAGRLAFPVPAARMLEAMNRSVDPCQDFYKFACGGWISGNPIPQSQAFWDRLSFLREQLLRHLRTLLEEPDKEYDPKSVKLARTLYKTCMNTSKKIWSNTKGKGESNPILPMFPVSSASVEALGLKPIHETLIKLGLSEDPPSDIGNSTTDVSWFSGAAQRMLGLNLFVQFHVSEDIRDTRKNRITVRDCKRKRDFDFSMIVLFLSTLAFYLTTVPRLFDNDPCGFRCLQE